MGVQLKFFPNSRPFEIEYLKNATIFEDGAMSKEDKAKLNSLIPGISGTRPRYTLFVGEPVDNTVIANGSAIAPFATPQQAIAAALALGYDGVLINVSPGDYSAAGALTIPTNMAVSLVSSLTSNAIVASVVITGSSDASHQVSFFGFRTTTVDFVGAPGSTNICVFVGAGEVGSVTNSGNINVGFVCAGVISPNSLVTSITLLGTVNLGIPSTFIASRTDIRGAVTAGVYSTTECRNPASITARAGFVNIANAPQNVGFPFQTFITFTDAIPGNVSFDATSLLSFGLVKGQITDGIFNGPNFFAQLLRAQVPLALGIPVSVVADDTVNVSGTTFAEMLALAGFTITDAANANDLLMVVGEGGSIVGFFAGLVASEAQYAAGGAIIPESALAIYIAGAASGSWYRRLGFALNTMTITPNFGEPQQVP